MNWLTYEEWMSIPPELRASYGRAGYGIDFTLTRKGLSREVQRDYEEEAEAQQVPLCDLVGR